MLGDLEYFEPQTPAEAIALLTEHAQSCQIVAGGLDLIPRMRVGRIKAHAIINIGQIPGLSSIEYDNQNGLRFGAMTPLYDLERSPRVQQHYPILYESIHSITSVQTKHIGTLVGNICVATPASDLSPVLMVLGASLRISGPSGDRQESLEDFYIDYGKTSLQPGEFVVGVEIPAKSPGSGCGFLKLTRNHADIAKLNAAASITVKDGQCSEAKIAIGAAAPVVIRATLAEQLLQGQAPTAELIQQAAALAADSTRPIDDFRSTADYRKKTSAVLVRRALERAVDSATAAGNLSEGN